jgi:hypothetical protein
MNNAPLILTDKGQRWMLNAYRVTVTVVGFTAFIALLGLVGWVQGL